MNQMSLLLIVVCTDYRK